MTAIISRRSGSRDYRRRPLGRTGGELAAAAATTDFFRRRRWHGEAEIRMAYLNTFHTHPTDTARAAGHVVD